MSDREIRVDLRVHPLLAIQKTAAALAERCVIQITILEPDAAMVRFTDRADVLALPDSVASFMSLLHDITLQERIADQTKEIRAALIRAAFTEALTAPK